MNPPAGSMWAPRLKYKSLYSPWQKKAGPACLFPLNWRRSCVQVIESSCCANGRRWPSSPVKSTRIRSSTLLQGVKHEKIHQVNFYLEKYYGEQALFSDPCL